MVKYKYWILSPLAISTDFLWFWNHKSKTTLSLLAILYIKKNSENQSGDRINASCMLPLPRRTLYDMYVSECKIMLKHGTITCTNNNKIIVFEQLNFAKRCSLSQVSRSVSLLLASLDHKRHTFCQHFNVKYNKMTYHILQITVY